MSLYDNMNHNVQDAELAVKFPGEINLYPHIIFIKKTHLITTVRSTEEQINQP